MHGIQILSIQCQLWNKRNYNKTLIHDNKSIKNSKRYVIAYSQIELLVKSENMINFEKMKL
jgi:hypothetical protein